MPHAQHQAPSIEKERYSKQSLPPPVAEQLDCHTHECHQPNQPDSHCLERGQDGRSRRVCWQQECYAGRCKPHKKADFHIPFCMICPHENDRRVRRG